MANELTDEQRVRAVYPKAYFDYPGNSLVRIRQGVYPNRAIGDGCDISNAWAAALHHPTVAEFERRRPHMADTPELPEMDVTEEDWRLAYALSGIEDPRNVFADALCDRDAFRFCRERQLREARATIAALRQKNKCVDCRDYETNIRTWIAQLGGNPDVSHISLELERLIAAHAKPAPLTGPAMEALVRACAEAVWSLFRERSNLTWDARKERTFESLAALVVGTQGTLLKLVRDARQRRYGGRRARGSNHTTACSIWGDDGLGGTGGQFPEPPPCNCGALENYQRARAEAAEAKVRDAEDAITMWESREAAFTSEGETFEQVIVNLRARVRELEAAAGAARAEVRNLLESAHPNDKEHPTMWAAWQRAETLLSEPKGASK